MASSESRERTCLSCPSYLNPGDAAAFFGKSIDAPMCAKYGYVLGRSEATVAQNTATARDRAKACDSYMGARPTRPPASWATEVALPNPDRRVELDALDPKRTLVKSCAQCMNFIPDDQVAESTGWLAGACRAKGKLILTNRRVPEATSCPFRQTGPRTAGMNLELLPIYRSASLKDEVRLARAGDSLVEPLDYPTDREVTDEEADNGIQAWRRIEDPEGTGNSVLIPVFNPKCFPDDERDLIPQTGDDEHPELYFDHNGAVYRIAVLWMELDETPAAWGQPGVGKTEVGRHLAWLMQIPFYRFSIKESTELYELEGSKEYEPEKGTYFRAGRFTNAWSQKSVIVVDEPNMGRPEVWSFFRPCFDNSKQLVIDADGGRRVERNDFCFPLLAMNPAWSPLNVGTSPIGLADASRLMHIEFGLPNETVERKIIENRVKLDGWVIDKVRLNLVMSVSAKIRELCEMGELSLSWGIRENLKVSRALRFFDPLSAFRMAAADYLEPAQRESFLDQVRATASGMLPPITLLVD